MTIFAVTAAIWLLAIPTAVSLALTFSARRRAAAATASAAVAGVAHPRRRRSRKRGPSRAECAAAGRVVRPGGGATSLGD